MKKIIDQSNENPFKVGHIYHIRYRAYRHDPTPLILVLYPGRIADFKTAKAMDLMHAINLNYLQGTMIQSIYHLVAAVATKKLSGSDTYRLYHYYMKDNLNPAIRMAYRTYIPSKISNPKMISKGFKESLGFIENLKQSREQKITELVKAKVEATKAVEQITNTIIGKHITNPISLEEAENRARFYMNEILKAKRPDEIDLSKFTMILGQRYKK